MPSKLEACKPSKLFVYAVFTVLALVFINVVIHSLIRWHEGLVGISRKEMKSKYAKFPSISICLGLDVKKDDIGFKELRPLNETLRDLSYVRHLSNGYG